MGVDVFYDSGVTFIKYTSLCIILLIRIMLYLQGRRFLFSQREVSHFHKHKTFYFLKLKSSYNIILIVNKIMLYIQE